MRKVIIRNSAICECCGKHLESKFTHDFQICDCENETYVDGGTGDTSYTYLRRGGKDLSKIKDTSIVAIYDDDGHFMRIVKADGSIIYLNE